VHDNKFVEAKKRLYMTATPRIYAEQSKQKALESEATLASMDDDGYYGREFHRLNFGKAVSQGLLSDYKVLVLAVSEDHVSRQLQKLLTKDGELNLDDATKIVGCYNGLLKRSSNPEDFVVDTAPMRSAVAFSRSIKDSKRLANLFEMVTAELNKNEVYGHTLNAEADHVDGTYNMESRLEKLDWLKEKTTDTVRILSNARCLSEGVDVPALDAVLFLNPRDSQVDVVQSVGRVMRKSPGKQYGYVILPITVPAGKTAEEALADNNRYKVVWQVLQALRSHDERFDAMVNKIDLNGDSDERLRVIGVGGSSEDQSEEANQSKPDTSLTLDFPLGEWKDAILAKIVQKVGERGYWENWAKDVSEIAERFILRIEALLDTSKSVQPAFTKFLKGLQDNLNPEISRTDAVEMLAQHLITKPVFDALFEDYSFSENNPVSVVMQDMLTALEDNHLLSETESLDRFYDSVRMRASGIKNVEGRQRIIKELYEKFFKYAFENTSERLGIVYTPTEVVDFIIHSVDSALKREFGTSLGEKGVHILDPFTGTGTFIVRLLQSGLIAPDQIENKFRFELHANEIVLLAYYVAAINIEESFHSITGRYSGFPGIVLTDTFQMTEGKDELDSSGVFPDNNARVITQNELDIRVVIGNPPYSVGQTSANDQNENMKYMDLDGRIADTYVAKSNSRTRTSVYDSYIRAFRWASDRVKERGVICFVTNGSWLETGTADGFRKSLQEEFSSIYVFNLRGNQRTQGELSRREGGKVFGEGSRTPIAITLLVRNPESENQGKIKYFDIGDYLTREEKLSKIANFGDMYSLDLTDITPNSHGDWINQRNADFDALIPLVTDGKKGSETQAIFNTHSFGAITARDAWVYNFDKGQLAKNIRATVDFYNSQVSSLAGVSDKKSQASTDPTKISWSVSLFNNLEKGNRANFHPENVVEGLYRPFVVQNYYFDKFFNHSLLQLPKYFPRGKRNFAILTSGVGATGGFSALAIDKAPNYDALAKGRVFPLSHFVEAPKEDGLLGGLVEDDGRQSGITSWALNLFRKTYDSSITFEDLFFYTLGVLNSPVYQKTFENSLSKELPRIPLMKDFWGFSKSGRSLGELELDFDSLDEFPLEEEFIGDDSKPHPRIVKMKLLLIGDQYSIKVNESFTLKGIPKDALDFKIGGKSAVEWIVDRYQVKTDTDSGILNDPNNFSTDPDYILKRLRKAVTFGIKATKVLSSMPKYEVK
jgi:predicted helicase